MAHATPFATQVGLDLARRREELGEARVGRTDAPRQAKDDQADDEQADLAVPVDQVAAELAADNRGDNGKHEQPVKEAGRQIPEANSFAVHAILIPLMSKKQAPAGACCADSD